MDIKEFNLIYNKDSPFFGKGLESIIEQALKEEQVPHSIRPISDKKCDIIPAISFQTNMTHDKEVNIYERKSALVAGKSDPQDGSTVNKDFKQRTRNAQANPRFNPNSVPVSTSRPILVSSALHMSSSYNSSRSSRHSFTHASHNFPLRAPCNDAHARSTGYESSVSETSSYSKTTSNFSEKLPATGTEVPKNYLKDNRSAFDHSQQDKFNITGEYSSAPRLALFNENCCGIVKCEEKHTNCRKESLTNMADSSSERQTPTHSAGDSVSTWGCSFQKDPFNTVEKHLASTYTVDSHRELDGIGKDKAFDVCKSNGRISSEQITRCRNDLQTMPCESRTSGNAHESSEPPASAASPYHDRQGTFL
ncbi:uncharacterized protein LOC128549301 [Mercenaria mercenaria]|uniref:uncharacterized protein LOC128549301 n=1 Tax=Mercenaria mercenaria TaxID=6596 RepID=UPI00234F2CD7|nr:uncharacterized protein LOC128549301 [Mercenaria mercenaria]